MATQDDLRAAGFSDAEIAAHTAAEGETLKAAGFSSEEVAAHQGVVPDPKLPPSPGLLDRLYNGAVAYRKGEFDAYKAAKEGAVEGFGPEPLGLSDEHVQALRETGIFNDPAKGQVSPLRFLNEAIIRPAGVLADTVARSFNAGVHAVGGAVGSVVGSVTGDETAGEQAKREAINLQNFLLLEAGGVNPLTRAEHVAETGAVTDAHVGGLPTLRHFDDAATVLRSEEAAPVLRQLYDERGVLPAEVLHDAQTDVTILQDLAAGEVPKSYGGPKALPAPEEPPVSAVLDEAPPNAEVPSGGKPVPAPLEGGGELFYHQAVRPIDEFSDRPMYFDNAGGKFYTARDGVAGVIKANLDFKNPLVESKMTSADYNAIAEAWRQAGGDEAAVAEWMKHARRRSGDQWFDVDTAPGLADAIKSLGYDGIIVDDSLINKWAIALDPKSQVKVVDGGGAFRGGAPPNTEVPSGGKPIPAPLEGGGAGGGGEPTTVHPKTAAAVEFTDRIIAEAAESGAAYHNDLEAAKIRLREASELENDPAVKQALRDLADGLDGRISQVTGGKPSAGLKYFERGSAELRSRQLVPLEGGGAGGGGEPPQPPGGALPNDAAGRKALPKPDEPMTVRQAQDAMLERINVGEHDPKDPITFQKLYTQFVDDLNPVHEAVKKALKETGDTGAAVDPYQLFRLTRGLAGKADQFLLHGTFNALSFKTNGVGLADVLKPLTERVAKGEHDLIDQFRAYTTAKRTIELADRGVETGMPLEAAKVIVNDPHQIKAFEAVHRAAFEYQNRLAMYLRDAGVVSPKAFDAMMQANKNYTPFYRYVSGEVLPNGRTGRALSARNPLKKIKGSDAEIVDPIESIIKNTYTYLALAEKNMAGTALVDLLKEADAGLVFRREMLPNEARKAAPEPKLRQIEGPGTPKLEGPRQPALEGEVQPPSQSVVEREWPAGTPKKEPPLLIGTDIIDAEFTELKEALKKEGVEDPDLLTVFRTLGRPQEGDAISIFRNGVKESYLTSDRELLEAWRGLDGQTIGTITKVLAIPSRALRAGATLTLEFSIGNLVRDFQTAFINTKGALFSPIDTARGAVALLKKGETYQDWLKGGGANAALVSMDRRYLQENLLRLGKETGLGEGVWNLINSPLHGLRMLSEFAENTTRLGEFQKAMREAGNATKENIQAAAFRSREATLDFSRVGSQMRAYNMITAFANANIQGTDRLVRALHDAPLSTATRIAIGVTLPSLLLWAYNRGDPVYRDLPEWQRDLFYIFPIHSWRDSTPQEADQRSLPAYLRRTTEDGKFQIDEPTIFRLKKDFTTGILFGSGAERAAEAFFEANPKAFKGFLRSVSEAVAPSLVPTIATPVVEQFANRSTLTGAPIVPQSAEKLLPEYRYVAGTTELAKTLARAIGAFPGMRAAALDPQSPANGLANTLTTPVLIEQYIRDWTGGIGTYALGAMDLALRKVGALPDPVKPTPTLADIPFARSFLTRYPSAQAQSVQDFYDRNAANTTYVETLRAKAAEGDAAAVARIQEMAPSLVSLTGLQKAMGAQEKMVRMIYSTDKLDPQQKRQDIDTLYFQIIRAAQAGNQMLDAIEEASKKK